jgi:hypothetical protein
MVLLATCWVMPGHRPRMVSGRPSGRKKNTERRSRAMYKASLVAVSCAVAALMGVAIPASAATAGWMVNGTTLSGSKALATTAKAEEPTRISFAGLTITCSGVSVNSTAPEISSPNMSSATALEFTSCAVSGSCTLPTSTFKTLPVLTETTLEGSLATVATVRPKTGTVFATFELEGEACGFAGNLQLTGQYKSLAPAGQDENTLQLTKTITTEASKELFIGKTAVALLESDLLKLASGERWSFL